MGNYLIPCLAVLHFMSFVISSNAAAAAVATAVAYNVVNFGANADGTTDSTGPFLGAWESACNSPVPTTVYVPRGSFLIQPVEFAGPCKSKILFRIHGTITASPWNYMDSGGKLSGYWISFYKVSGVSIHGGTLDGRGDAFWTCRLSGNSCPPGARSISFIWSNDIVVSGLTSINSQIIHVSVDESHNLEFRNLRIKAPKWSPNTDGIHIQASTGITITNSAIMTGDDCISVGPGSANLWIDRIACGPGHGISIGSLAEHAKEAGVENMTVTDVVFSGTQNGVRIKSWARPSSGFAKHINFRNIIMRHVDNPILIDQNYCPHDIDCPDQSSGVKISEVKYENIKGTSATKVAVNFGCSPSNPCTGIVLKGIDLTCANQPATSYCDNAYGSTSGEVAPISCL